MSLAESIGTLPTASTTDYQINRTQSYSEGLVALPVAGTPPQPISLVRIHAPIEFESVYWSAVRMGGAPIIPSWRAFLDNPNSSVVNRIFLGGYRTALIPVPDISGHNWCCAGVYNYAITTPAGLNSKFNLGIYPWERRASRNRAEPGKIDPNDHYIPAENFVTDLLATRTGSTLPELLNPVDGRNVAFGYPILNSMGRPTGQA